jgi:hypothetical protein
MTTPDENSKKSPKIANHKRPPAKLDSKIVNGSQAFDIIPRAQVRPTVTSRPVLTPTQPEQTDNTLQTASQAASSQLTHQKLTFNTSSAPELPGSTADGNDTEALLDKVASLTSEKPAKKPHIVPPKPFKEAATETDEEPQKQATKDLGESSDASDAGGEPAHANNSSAVQDEQDRQDQAFQDTEETVAAEDGALDNNIDDTSVAAADEKEQPAKVAENTDAADNDNAAEQDKASSQESAEGSIDHIFKQNEQQPIEHSQALKDELQTFGDKEPKDGEDGELSEEHPHHELYGGKPVIVIHKARGAQATLNWILWLIFCLLLALVIVDGLLDADIIKTDYNVPHTNIL